MRQDIDPLALLSLVKGTDKAVKVIGKTNVRDAVAPGSYSNLTLVAEVSIPVLNVGEDYEQRIVAKADPWGLLAVALSKLNGVTVDALTREALNIPPHKVSEIKKQATSAISAVKEPTWTLCKGKVTLPGGAVVKLQRGQ
jgi:hypothetical protein